MSSLPTTPSKTPGACGLAPVDTLRKGSSSEVDLSSPFSLAPLQMFSVVPVKVIFYDGSVYWGSTGGVEGWRGSRKESGEPTVVTSRSVLWDLCRQTLFRVQNHSLFRLNREGTWWMSEILEPFQSTRGGRSQRCRHLPPLVMTGFRLQDTYLTVLNVLRGFVTGDRVQGTNCPHFSFRSTVDTWSSMKDRTRWRDNNL